MAGLLAAFQNLRQAGLLGGDPQTGPSNWFAGNVTPANAQFPQGVPMPDAPWNPNVVPKPGTQRKPASLEEALRWLWMDPESWMNKADVLPGPTTNDLQGRPDPNISPWYNPLGQN
jgi:hypothetical protein